MSKHTFTVERGGKTHKCERIVSGSRTLSQTVSVEGYGSRSDMRSYGSTGIPESSMAINAILIAQEMISDAGD